MKDRTSGVPTPLLRWWRSHRPLGWSLDEHLNNPDVNLTEPEDRNLARFVARLVKSPQEYQIVGYVNRRVVESHRAGVVSPILDKQDDFIIPIYALVDLRHDKEDS